MLYQLLLGYKILEVEVGEVCGMCKGEIRNAHRSLVRKPEWKRLLGKPRNRWEANMEIGWESVDGTHLAEDRDQ
jgi:hypothetical protein